MCVDSTENLEKNILKVKDDQIKSFISIKRPKTAFSNQN